MSPAWRKRSYVMLAAVVVVLVLAGVGGYRYYDYVETDPQFCRSCHLMEWPYQKWAESAHAVVTCHNCHKESSYAKTRMLFRWATLKPETIERHAVVDSAQCAECHTSEDPRWKQVADTKGHQIHADKLELECTACHAPAIHEFIPLVETCQACHQLEIQAPGMANFHCTTCHNFLAKGEEEIRPDRQDCLTCHAEMQVKGEFFPKDGAMAFNCSVCHQPHQKIRISAQDCQGCHEVREAGLHADAAHGECLKCHLPHQWRAEGRITCEACHSNMIMVHYADEACADCHSFQVEKPDSWGKPKERMQDQGDGQSL